ncbi:hypothetical protein C8R44DRAFT_972856 [Mycena epipterygia]|nr:hypothetical protein C8R44DRAFT_972856 [Mycena epipterygia]
MSLTLPVEAMSRLQVSFKVILPDGRFSFDMAENPTPCSTRVSGLKLHFQGTHDETGGVTFTVWASESGHPRTNSTDDDCTSPDESDVSYAHNPSINSLAKDIDLYKRSETGGMSSLDPLSVQAPAIPSIFPSLGDSNSGKNSKEPFTELIDIFDDHDAFQLLNGSVNHSEEPFTEMMDIFDDPNPFTTGWGRLDDHHENSLPLYSDPPYDPQSIDNPPNILPPRLTPLLSTYDPLFSIAGTADTSPTLSADTDAPSSADASIASSPSESLHHDSPPSSSADPSRPFKCLQTDCPLWFKREYTRRVHMNIHLPSTAKDRKFPCTFDGCAMLFSRKHDRLRHEVGNHGINHPRTTPSR